MPSSPLATRVIAYDGSGRSKLESREILPPRDRELLIRTEMSGLCGTDLVKIRHDSIAPGTVLGHEVVGLVEQKGAAIDHVDVGDRVVVPHHVSCGICKLCRDGSEPLCPSYAENLLFPGGFSDRILVRERAALGAIYRVPDGRSSEAAVFLEPAACVYRGIRRSGLLELSHPRRVVIAGAGSMGLLHLLVIKSIDAAIDVTIIDPRADRRVLAGDLGANRSIIEMSGALDADVVFDTVGGTSVLESSLAALRPGGAVVLFAHAAADAKANFDLNSFFKHEMRVMSTYSSSLDDQRAAYDLFCSGALDAAPLVTHRLPLAAFERGVDLATRHVAIKVVFVFGESS